MTYADCKKDERNQRCTISIIVILHFDIAVGSESKTQSTSVEVTVGSDVLTQLQQLQQLAIIAFQCRSARHYKSVDSTAELSKTQISAAPTSVSLHYCLTHTHTTHTIETLTYV